MTKFREQYERAVARLDATTTARRHLVLTRPLAHRHHWHPVTATATTGWLACRCGARRCGGDA